MFRIWKIKRIFWLLAVLGVWVSFAGSAVGADNAQRVTNINDGMRPVVIEDAIMIIDLSGNNFVTQKETTVNIGPYKARNQVGNTQFLDSDGQEVDAGYLKPNQRVLVRGFKISRTAVFAKSVKVTGKYLGKEHRTIERLSPIQTR